MLKSTLKVVHPILLTVIILLGIPFRSVPSCFAQDDAEPNHLQDNGEDPGQAFLCWQNGLRAFKMGDYNSCINLCKQGIDLDHRNKNLYHLQALAMAQSGDTYNAMLSFRSALGLDYNFVECRNDLGLLQKKLGKRDEAKTIFQECIRTAPNFPDAHYHLGQILQEQGDLEGAIEEYETAVHLAPKYFAAQRDLGLAIFERASTGLTDVMDAEEKLLLAARLVPTNPMIHYHLGSIYCASGKLDDAETEFRKALALDPKLAAAHYELGRLRYYRGDLDRCLAEMRLSSKVPPIYSESQKYPKVDIIKLKEYMAKCFEFKGWYDQSIADWKEVASMQHDNQSTLKHISDLESLAKKDAKHRSKLSYDPDEIQALLIKGITQADAGEIPESKGTFEKVLELAPGKFEPWQYHGSLLEASGDLHGALSDYQKALELMPNFDGLYYNMAYLLEKLNLPGDAGAMYRQFHELAGKYPYDPRHIVAMQQEEAREQVQHK